MIFFRELHIDQHTTNLSRKHLHVSSIPVYFICFIVDFFFWWNLWTFSIFYLLSGASIPLNYAPPPLGEVRKSYLER